MSVASKKCALDGILPTTVYRSTDRDPAYRAMEVDSDGAAPPPDDTPRTSLLCAAGMKRAKVDAVRDLLDEDEIETEQDFKRLLGNGRMYAKFETKHEQKLPLNQLTVLETLRDWQIATSFSCILAPRVPAMIATTRALGSGTFACPFQRQPS